LATSRQYGNALLGVRHQEKEVFGQGSISSVAPSQAFHTGRTFEDCRSRLFTSQMPYLSPNQNVKELKAEFSETENITLVHTVCTKCL